MIIGLGTDIIDVHRIENQVKKGKAYIDKIFTPNEIAYCESKARKAQHYAARFAAKEAFLKAIGTGWRGGIAFNEVEIMNDEYGKPVITLHGKAKTTIQKICIKQMCVSLSHVKDMAIAIVIIEK